MLKHVFSKTCSSCYQARSMITPYVKKIGEALNIFGICSLPNGQSTICTIEGIRGSFSSFSSKMPSRPFYYDFHGSDRSFLYSLKACQNSKSLGTKLGVDTEGVGQQDYREHPAAINVRGIHWYRV